MHEVSRTQEFFLACPTLKLASFTGRPLLQNGLVGLQRLVHPCEVASSHRPHLGMSLDCLGSGFLVWIFGSFFFFLRLGIDLGDG